MQVNMQEAPLPCHDEQQGTGDLFLPILAMSPVPRRSVVRTSRAKIVRVKRGGVSGCVGVCGLHEKICVRLVDAEQMFEAVPIEPAINL